MTIQYGQKLKMLININVIIYKLETEAVTPNKLFKDNSLLLNEDKCNFMIFEHKQTRTEKANIKIGNATIEETKKAKLLGITLDSKLNFEEHIKNLCKEAGKKINALVRITTYMNEYKRSLLMKTFILSHFNYCPLLWMYCSRKSRKLIENIHERALRVAYNDFESSFENIFSQ